MDEKVEDMGAGTLWYAKTDGRVSYPVNKVQGEGKTANREVVD